MREALTTSPRVQLPYRIDHERLAEQALTLRLPEMIADVFTDPEAMVARAAVRSTHLVTVLDHGAVVGFMFTRRERVDEQYVAAMPLIGVDPSHGVGATALTLLSALDDLFASSAHLAFTVTAQPKLERLWTQHFGDRVVGDVPTALARDLWATLGVTAEPADPVVCRGTFPGELTASELAHIKRSNKTYGQHCARLDAGAGDRRLLVARL